MQRRNGAWIANRYKPWKTQRHGFFETNAICLATDDSPQQMVSLAEELLNNPCELQRLRDASSRFYDRYCSVDSVVRTMRNFS